MLFLSFFPFWCPKNHLLRGYCMILYLEGDMMNLTILSPKKTRYQELLSILKSQPDFSPMANGKVIWASRSLPDNLRETDLVFVDILLWKDFSSDLLALKKQPYSPFLVLFHFRDELCLKLSKQMYLFDACLDLKGDLFNQFFLLTQQVSGRMQTYTMKTKKDISTVPASRIYYCEMDKHCVRFHLASGSVKFWGTMEAEEPKLAPLGIVRIHKSYMVNLRHVIKSTSSQVILQTGITLPVGRKYHAKYQEAYEHYLGITETPAV